MMVVSANKSLKYSRSSDLTIPTGLFILVHGQLVLAFLTRRMIRNQRMNQNLRTIKKGLSEDNES